MTTRVKLPRVEAAIDCVPSLTSGYMYCFNTSVLKASNDIIIAPWRPENTYNTLLIPLKYAKISMALKTKLKIAKEYAKPLYDFTLSNTNVNPIDAIIPPVEKLDNSKAFSVLKCNLFDKVAE